MGSIRLLSWPSIWHLVTQGKGDIRCELVIASCGDAAVHQAAESLAAYIAAQVHRAAVRCAVKCSAANAAWCSVVLEALPTERQLSCKVLSCQPGGLTSCLRSMTNLPFPF